MTWLTEVTGQPAPKPPRILVYGQPGIGKTSFAAKLPKPILIDLDKGADQVQVDRLQAPADWEKTLELVRAIGKSPGEYKSIVIDTLDALEDLATRHVCAEGKKKSLSVFDFGAGYEALSAEWRVLLAELDGCRASGLLVCLLAHSVVRQAQDPQLGQYDQFTAQLQKKTWSATQRWCDVVGFATFDAARLEDERRAILTGKRVVFTTKGSGYEAKNRFGLPAKLPLEWSALEPYVMPPSDKAEDVRARIGVLAIGTDFQAKATEYVLAAGDDVRKLLEVERALREKVKG